jgi:hypothetical protein
MSNAKLAGYAQRQLAILALRGNRPDDDAVLVIDETGFLKQGGVVRSGATIHWFRR